MLREGPAVTSPGGTGTPTLSECSPQKVKMLRSRAPRRSSVGVVVTPVGEVVLVGEWGANRVHPELDDAHPGDARQATVQVPHHQEWLDNAFVVEEDQHTDS